MGIPFCSCFQPCRLLFESYLNGNPMWQSFSYLTHLRLLSQASVNIHQSLPTPSLEGGWDKNALGDKRWSPPTTSLWCPQEGNLNWSWRGQNETWQREPHVSPQIESVYQVSPSAMSPCCYFFLSWISLNRNTTHQGRGIGI